MDKGSYNRINLGKADAYVSAFPKYLLPIVLVYK